MFEGFIEKISPSLAKKRAIERYQLDIVKKMKPTNYGEHAGSHRKKAFRYWNPKVRSPDDDIGNHKDTLTGRSRDLVMGTPLALGAVRKIRTNVVGIGLRLKSTIDSETIGITSEEKAVLEKHIEKVWELWAESTSCDMSRMSNFYELQSIAILSTLIDGDCFALLPLEKRAGEVFDLKIQLVESERCQSPPSISISENIRNGVEIGKNGEIKAYHFAPPYNWVYTGETEYTRVEAYGATTGRKNALLLMEKERIGQRRGVPLLAPVMEAIKQLGRYTNAELTAAVVSAMFTVFVENKIPETTGNAFNGLPPAPHPTLGREQTKDIGLGNGTVVELDEGQSIKESNPNRPNTAFEGFMKAMCMQIGSALELPHEVLLNAFNSSYSASRAALLEAWKMYKMRRSWFVDDFCNPVFHEFMDEAVAKGYINAPGYFDNPLMRKAYLKCEWYGPTQGQLNPLQEVSAAIKRVENDFSTRSREAREMNGSSWNDNIKQRIIEEKNRKELIESED